MPIEPSNELQAAGFPTALSAEIQRQAQAASGSIAGFVAAGLPVSVAVNLAPMMTSGTIDPDLLIASGLNHEQARTLASVQFGVAPANTVAPSISGDPINGETLTLANGTWDGDMPRTFSRVWKRDGVEISGATATTYVLVPDDVGTMISGTVTLTNAFGAASADAPAVGPVSPSP